jgi:hypothetical protein
MLTEFTIGYSLAASSQTDRGAILIWELGAMANGRRRLAVGLSVFGSVSDQEDTYGPRLRLRYWVSPEVGIDFGPGLAFGRSKPGFNGQLGISAGDRIGAVLTLQTLPASLYEPSTRALFGGLRLGSGFGVVGGIALPLIGLIYLLSCNCLD